MCPFWLLHIVRERSLLQFRIICIFVTWHKLHKPTPKSNAVHTHPPPQPPHLQMRSQIKMHFPFMFMWNRVLLTHCPSSFTSLQTSAWLSFDSWPWSSWHEREKYLKLCTIHDGVLCWDVYYSELTHLLLIIFQMYSSLSVDHKNQQQIFGWCHQQLWRLIVLDQIVFKLLYK